MNKLIIFDMDGVIVDSIPVAYELILDTIPQMTKSDFLKLKYFGRGETYSEKECIPCMSLHKWFFEERS